MRMVRLFIEIISIVDLKIINEDLLNAGIPRKVSADQFSEDLYISNQRSPIISHQSTIRRVAAQISLRFQGKSLGSEGNFLKI